MKRIFTALALAIMSATVQAETVTINFDIHNNASNTRTLKQSVVHPAYFDYSQLKKVISNSYQMVGNSNSVIIPGISPSFNSSDVVLCPSVWIGSLWFKGPMAAAVDIKYSESSDHKLTILSCTCKSNFCSSTHSA